MTVEHAAQRARLWGYVDSLTKPTRVPVNRDNGTTTYATVPSLWEQSTDVLTEGTRSPVCGSSTSERAPLDLKLMMIRSAIMTATRSALLRRHQQPAQTVPTQIRQLAVLAIAEPDRLPDHAERFGQWATALAQYLTDAHITTSVRLRNSACVRCGARQSLADSPDGPVVTSALVVDFSNGYVRACRCLICGSTWFRGQDLLDLAEALGCTPISA